MDTGKVPLRSKYTIIIPALKYGSKKSDPASFSPISLTSYVVKVFERGVKMHIQKYLESNDMLGNFQHSFREKKSSLSQLLIYYDKINLNFDSLELNLALINKKE